MSFNVPVVEVLVRSPRSTVHRPAPLVSNATTADVDTARRIVAAAIADSSISNRAQYENFKRNNYGPKPGTVVGQAEVARRQVERQDSEPNLPASFEVTPTIAAAATLLAELGQDVISSNSSFGAGLNAASSRRLARAAAAQGSFWMGSISRKGTSPYNTDPSFKVSVTYATMERLEMLRQTTQPPSTRP